MSESVIGYLRKKKGMLIGMKTAENLKVTVGSALIEKDGEGKEIIKTVEARGRD